MCPKMILEMLKPPVMAPIFHAKPVDVLDVCSCTEKAFGADSRLQTYLNVDEKTLQARTTSEQFKAYITVRLLHSSLTCLTPALDASLSATSPGQ
jgi:hypothetical protein